MKLFKRKVYIPIAALFLVFAIAVYGSIAAQPITLHLGVMAGSVWDVPESDSYSLLDQAIAEFEKQHPYVKISYQSGIRPEDYKEYLAEQIIMDEIPDVLFLTTDILSVMAENGTLKKLNSFIKHDHMDLDMYYATSLEQGMMTSNYYALPYESVPKLMFVNKSLLEKEHIEMPNDDWTWDDFYHICQSVTKDSNSDGIIDQFGFYNYQWEDAVYSNGVQIYDEVLNEVDLADQRIIEATEFMRKLVALHSEKVTSAMFDKGLVAFCPMNYSAYRTYMPYPWRVKKYSGFEWDCIAMPSGPQGDNISQIDTLMLGMSSKSKHQKLAWEFMKYLSSNKEFQTKLVTSSQGVSVLKEVMRSQDVMDALKVDNPGNSTFELHVLDEIMESGIAIHQTEDHEQIMQALTAQMDSLLESDQDIENALIVLQRQINHLLQR